MSNHAIMEDWIQSWFAEADAPGSLPSFAPPGGDPNNSAPGGGDPSAPPATAPPATAPPSGGDGQDSAAPPDDISSDPEHPEMPDEDSDSKEDDFEVWKNKYHKESIKGNVTILTDLLNQVVDRDLDPVDDKFVYDNLNIQYLRSMSNIMDASKKIRKGLNDDLDRNNPATSVAKHLHQALQEQPMLANQFIKMLGYYAIKGEIHRKFVGALTGSVQVSSGAEKEDLIIWDNEYSIMISTRMNAKFGDINIGHWSLQHDDPHHFLAEPEREKLETGAPQEREALRHRVILESIFNRFKTRGFIITVVGTDGTIYLIGWDLATSLKAAYLDGKLVIRTKVSENSECMLDDKGNITAYLDMDILYSKESGDVDASGQPAPKQVRFIERRNGMLFLVAALDVIKEASTTVPGLVMLELPFTGNPSDLKRQTHAVYSVAELLARQP